MKKLFFLLTVCFLLTAGPLSAARDSLKIMCLGDSVTGGDSQDVSADAYRTELSRLLTAAGWQIEFSNKGHGGYTSAGIDNIVEQDLAEVQPGMVLYMIGTNDITHGYSYETSIFYIRSTINKIINSGVSKIYLAAVCLRFDSLAARQNNLAQFDRELVVEFRKLGKPVYLSDQNAYLSSYINFSNWTEYYKDVKHPNSTGYRLMASSWYESLTDSTPPGAVTDLKATGTAAGQIQLTWTAPTDNESTNRALRYILKMSDQPITEANWDLATEVTELATYPAVGGTAESFTLNNLVANKLYSFAIKSEDNNGNLSALSNVVEVQATSDSTKPELSEITFDGIVVHENDIISPTPLIRAVIHDLPALAARGSRAVNPATIRILINNIPVTDGTASNGCYDSFDPETGIMLYQVKNELTAGSHSFSIEAADYNGNVMSLYTISNLRVFEGETVIDGQVLNYPNPFNPEKETTKICYQLTREADIKLYIFDYAFRPVYQAYFAKESNGGRIGYNEITWDGRTSAGGIVANGVYFGRLLEGRRILGKVKIAVLR